MPVVNKQADKQRETRRWLHRLSYPEEALHQLVLPLLALSAALRQLDDHSHVTRRQDGLHALDQLVEQLWELQ